MSLLYQIENLSYNLTDPIDWDNIDNINPNKEELRSTIDYFLSHLIDNHDLPGDVYRKLMGIGYWIKTESFLTRKQKRYSILSMAAYWDQLDLFKIHT